MFYGSTVEHRQVSTISDLHESRSDTVRACKFVDLLQSKQFRKELSFNFREKLMAERKGQVYANK